MTQPSEIDQPKKSPGISPAADRFRLRLPGVPVFNYHGLTESFPAGNPEAAQRFWLTPAQFGAHLAHIREAGFRVAILEELEECVPNSAGKARTVVLTFDDGLASDYEFAFPLLAKFSARGVFFVNTSTVGQAGYLTWSQIAEMHRAGMSIQSHSHHHLDLTVLPTQALEGELTDSKRCLEDHLACPVEFLAAPHGLVSRRVVRTALVNGYRAVCSTRCWPANPRSSVFTRITLHRDITPDGFHGFLTGEVSSYARRLSLGLLYRPRTIAERLVGTIRYRWLRQAAPVSK
jgi:peptidoglycan/xylan/chitin deacetylase (PgdA/CDA1 family)